MKMTKKNERRLHLYRFAKYRDIYEAYLRPNIFKVSRFRTIHAEMVNVGGYDLRITGSGTTNFACAYRVDCEDGTHLVYHGANNVYDFLIGGDV